MEIADLGLTGAFIVIVIREVFQFVRAQRNGGNPHGFGDLKAKLDEMDAKRDEGRREFEGAVREIQAATGGLGKLSEMVATVARQTEVLYEMHNQKDSEGVPIWYVRRSLEEAIEHLSKSIETQTTVMTALMSEMKDVRRDLRDLGGS